MATLTLGVTSESVPSAALAPVLPMPWLALGTKRAVAGRHP